MQYINCLLHGQPVNYYCKEDYCQSKRNEQIVICQQCIDLGPHYLHKNKIIIPNFHLQSFQGNIIRQWEGHQGSIWHIEKFNNRYLATTSCDKSLRIWDSDQGTCLQTLKFHNKCTFQIRWVQQDLIASCSGDNTIKLSNWRTGQCIATFTGHTHYILSLRVLNRNLLVSCSLDKTIRFWHVQRKKQQKIIKEFWQFRTVLKFNKLLIISAGSKPDGSEFSPIKIWNINSYMCIKQLQGHNTDIFSLEKLNNLTLISGGIRHIKIWNIVSGQCLKSIDDAHENKIRRIVKLSNFSFASISEDEKIKIWNSLSYECDKIIDTKTKGLALTLLDNYTLVSAGMDKQIKIWQ